MTEFLVEQGLTPKETKIAKAVAQGLSNKEAANEANVTEKTVKFHLTNIYKKLNVKSRAQLIVKCLPHLTPINTSNCNH